MWKPDYLGKQETFNVDNEADIADLPNHVDNNVGFYSKAIVNTTGNIYTLLSTDEWVLFGGE